MFVDRIGFTLISLVYLVYFYKNDSLSEAWLLILYCFIFYLYDIFQLTDNLTKLDSISNGKKEIKVYSPDKYFDIFNDLKRWIPSRLLTIIFMFSLAPLTSFHFVYSFCLIILIIRFSRVLYNYFIEK